MNPVLAILIMAAITYLIRVLPMLLLREQIKSRFIQRFLYFLPYVILTSMVVPDIFNSDRPLPATLAGTVTALVLSWFEQSLIVVVIGAVLVSYLSMHLFL